MDPSPKGVQKRRHEELVHVVPKKCRAGEQVVAVFAIRLPFDIPVPDGAGFALRGPDDPEEPPWVRLSVRRVLVAPRDAIVDPYESGLAVVLGEAEPDVSAGYSGQTWVLAGTSNVLYENESAEVVAQGGALTIGFERCLAAINLMSQMGRLLASEMNSRSLTKDALDPYVVWFKLKEPSGELVEPHRMRLHNRQYNPLYVGHDAPAFHIDLSRALDWRLGADRAAEPHPFVAPRSLALQARGQVLRGGATDGFVLLQTAAEGLLRGVHRLLMVDSGETASKISADSDVPFKKLVFSVLPALLGGRWTGIGTAPERYMADLYEVRNHIVHVGREPTWQDIQPAFDAYAGLEAFLDSRIRANWRKHPRTLVAWCEPRAGGSLALPRAATSLADDLQGEPLPYWLPFDLTNR